MSGDTREHLVQVRFRVEAVEFCCPDQSIDSRCAFAASIRSTPLVVSGLPRAGHPARRSTIAPFLFCHCPVPAPAPEYRRRATSRRSSRDVAMPLPRAPVTGCILRPTPPWSSDPALLLRARRSPTADTTASGHNILKPTRGPEVLAPPSLARSDDLLLPLARFCHSMHKPASAELAGSL